MIHYIDVSGSMRDEDLIQVSKIIFKNFQSHDKIYTVSTAVTPVPDKFVNEFDLPSYLILDCPDRYGGFSPDPDIREDQQGELTILYTDGAVLSRYKNYFIEIFTLPACPVCLCSCPEEFGGIQRHLDATNDASHSIYIVHSA